MHAFLQRDRLEIEFMIFVEKLETTRFESAFLPCASANFFYTPFLYGRRENWQKIANQSKS
jgi:hypothetical protein